MYRSILVPLEGSPFAECALPVARDIARRTGASVELVRVSPTRHPPVHRSLLADSAKTYLEQIAARLRSEAAIAVTATLLESEQCAQAIVAQALRNETDLVVMTTHGPGAISQFWLGSMAYELLAILPLPMLLIHPHDGEPNFAAETTFRSMLITLDGSARAEDILEPAETFGKAFDAGYTLLRVIDEVPIGTAGLDSISLSSATPHVLEQIRAEQARVQKEAADYLEGVATRLRSRGRRVQTQVVADFNHDAAILKAARDPAYDVIALETQGRRGLARLVLGGVARKIIRAAPIPVLVRSATARGLSED